MTTRESTKSTRPCDVPTADVCLFPDCDREALRAGYCGRHYEGRPTTCAAKDCDRKATRRGYCHAHYQQLYARGLRAPVPPIARRRRRTPAELAQLETLMRQLGHEAEVGASVGFAEQIIVMLEDADLDAQIPQPARARWKEGHRLAENIDTERAGLRMQLGALLEHPVFLVAAVRALHDKLGA